MGLFFFASVRGVAAGGGFFDPAAHRSNTIMILLDCAVKSEAGVFTGISLALEFCGQSLISKGVFICISYAMADLISCFSHFGGINMWCVAPLSLLTCISMRG